MTFLKYLKIYILKKFEHIFYSIILEVYVHVSLKIIRYEFDYDLSIRRSHYAVYLHHYLTHNDIVRVNFDSTEI